MPHISTGISWRPPQSHFRPKGPTVAVSPVVVGFPRDPSTLWISARLGDVRFGPYGLSYPGFSW
eukprot:5422268-Pyramimonas_sp.AAC.1